MLWLSETRLRITIHWGFFLFERLLILICDFYKNNVFFLNVKYSFILFYFYFSYVYGLLISYIKRNS